MREKRRQQSLHLDEISSLIELVVYVLAFAMVSALLYLLMDRFEKLLSSYFDASIKMRKLVFCQKVPVQGPIANPKYYHRMRGKNTHASFILTTINHEKGYT